MGMRIAWVIVACIAACSSHDRAPEPTAAAPASPPPAPAPPVAAPAPADAAVDLGPLVDAAIAGCAWEPEGVVATERCDALVALLARAKGQDAALVEQLEHPDDPKRRYLAALALQRSGEAYRTDRALALRVLAVAKAERTPAVVFPLGWAVSRLDLAATGTADLVRELTTSHPDHIMRAHAVSDLAASNPKSAAAAAIVGDALRDKDWVVRSDAIAGLAGAREAPCDVIVRTIADDEDAGVAEAAVRAVRDHKACEGEAAPVIAAFTRRLDTGKLRYDPNVGIVLQDLCRAPSTAAADRASAAALGARMVAKRDLDIFRGAGLYAVFACDPVAGRKLAARVKSDPEIAQAAQEILASGSP